MQSHLQTVAAFATPLGVSGVGIIRLSGKKSFEIAAEVFSGKIVAGKICHGWIVNGDMKLDEVVLLPFKAPNSFTGENVIEIQGHGSPTVMREILDLIISKGAVNAPRGEFSKRAFLNRKIDLSQAEAILDLIHAKTRATATNAAKNLGGALKNSISQTKLTITKILAKILASLDFPDDVAEVEYEIIEKTLKTEIEKIEKILENARCHNIMREGIKIAIVGRPNVGKSSLFNTLLALERAIVTDVAGTTRDTITESIDINGICATLIDTAGIHESMDKVEKIGIENSRAAISEANLVLCLYDGTCPLTGDDEAVFNLVPDGVEKIFVATKQDCEGFCTGDKQIDGTHIKVSALKGVGIEALKSEISKKTLGINSQEIEFLTNQRQQECLKSALDALKTAKNAVEEGELQDLISIDIKQALINLDEITGEVVTEDVLTHIFENFCIGK